MTLEEMKRIKEEKGYSIKQLSDYTGVPLGTLQKIFSGETQSPRYTTRQALEKVLTQNKESGGLYEQALSKTDTMVKEVAVEYNVTREKKQGEYTLEDYYTQPDDRRVELIDGKFFEMEAPTFVHQHLISMLQYPMITYIQKKKGQCIPMQSPVDVRLDCDDRTMVQPDLIVICDRDKIRRWGIDGAPDFVLEVISDSSKRKDCILKLQKYACAGVREYWIIDPFKKTLITYDFSEDFVPVIRPLKGMAPLAIFGGELEIDLDSLAEVIRDWPNDGAE